MSTAALEHLRTGEGGNLSAQNWGNFMSTECLYAKHVQWRNSQKKRLTTQGVKSIGEILIYNLGHPGGEGGSLRPRPRVIIMMTLAANQSVKKKVPKIWPPSNPPPPPLHTLTPASFACYARLRVEWTHPLSQSNLTNSESYECLKLIFNCQSTWKWTFPMQRWRLYAAQIH